jgi:hypothetical protein
MTVARNPPASPGARLTNCRRARLAAAAASQVLPQSAEEWMPVVYMQ